ncbi:MAG: tetratricopeptide repeat protein [Candidatus Obscuribacterales bacterium]|nr:tetratricopeptide repeat protein [Candidatus Obscuribacterales bacterium]
MKNIFALTLLLLILNVVSPALAYKPGEYPGDPKIQPWNVKRWEKACKYMNEGNKLLAQGKTTNPLPSRAYLNAMLLYPWDFRFHANMGLYWSKTDPKKEAAVREYQKAICLCPSEWSNWNALANEYYRRGELNEAKPLLVQALSLNPPKELIASLKANLAQIDAELMRGMTAGSGMFKQQVEPELWAQPENTRSISMVR